MPNISITRRCKRDCSFCFAGDERGRREMLDMPRAVFEEALGFLERSNVPDARILGGEPTEHPAFTEYVALALDRGFGVTVFTSGLMPHSSLESLSRTPAGRVTVVLNTAVPGTDPPEWVEVQKRVCETLGARVQVGITLSRPECHPDFLLDLIETHGLQRHVRLGLAHPTWGGANVSLRPQSARVVGRSLEAFIAGAEPRGVQVDFDCGFTPCMFSPAFLAHHPAAAQSIGRRCNPIIDVLPEGTVIACYALSRAKRLASVGGATRDELVWLFDQELDRLLPMGAYRDCGLCEYRSNGLCGGGCRAQRALRWRPDALRLITGDGRGG